MNINIDEIIAKIHAQIDIEHDTPEDKDKKEALKTVASDLIKKAICPMLSILERKRYISLDDTEDIQDLETLMQILQKAHKALVEKTKPATESRTRKPKRIHLEVSKIGKELRNSDHRPDYYKKDEEGTLRGDLVRTGFTRGKKKNGHYEMKPVQSILMLDYNAEKLRQKGFDVPAFEYLETFDLEVLTHCVTLLKEGNEYVSAEMIYRLMNGGTDKELYPAMRERIYNALRRLDCTRIYIDATQEFEAGFNIRRHYEGALLPNEFLYDENISLNGQIVRDAIHFFRNSPLYDYSEAKEQVTSFPVEMLLIPTINGTEQNILLTHYLARFIIEASNDKNNLKPIRHYTLIYEYLGIEASNPQVLRNKQAQVREATKAILSEWVKRGFIKGFQELTEDDQPARPRVKVAKIRVELFKKKDLQALS